MDAEQQRDELEALQSIFEGDEMFTVVTDTTFQYKFGENSSSKSFLLELSWPPDYPSTSNAAVKLDLFYNKHLLPETKSKITTTMGAECETFAGMPMTYSLIDFARENFDEWMSDQPDEPSMVSHSNEAEDPEKSDDVAVISEAKELPMSKAQKRKMWDRGEGAGERERGWNWVEIVKHLSQTGKQT